MQTVKPESSLHVLAVKLKFRHYVRMISQSNSLEKVTMYRMVEMTKNNYQDSNE